MWGALGFVQMFVQRSWICAILVHFFCERVLLVSFFFLYFVVRCCCGLNSDTVIPELCTPSETNCVPCVYQKPRSFRIKHAKGARFLTLTDDMLGCLLVPNSGYPKMRITWIPPSNDEVHILLLPLLPRKLNS